MEKNQSGNLIELLPLIGIGVASVLCIIVSVLSLKSGFFIVFQNLFYIPIIISCFYYGKRGFVFSVVLAFMYLILILIFTKEPSIILLATGRVIIFICVAGVITYLSLLRKQTEELRVVSAYTRNLVEASLDSLMVIGMDGKITDMNATMQTMTGYTRTELIGTDFNNYFTDPEQAKAGYREALQIGCLRNLSLELQHRDGHPIPVLYDASVFRNEQGKVAGVFAAVRDITERKEAEETLRLIHAELEKKVAERTRELSEANIRLQELDRLKSMFIASMSHELRTPLNSIIGFTGLLLMGISGSLSEEQRKQLTMAKNSAHHLLSLINDVIDVSKIEADKLELSIEKFNLSDLLYEVRDSLKLNASQKGLSLFLDMPEQTIYMENDRRRIRQIIVNLAGNAVKYTDTGEIKIHAEQTNGKVEIAVSDTGPGIREEDMKKLFAAFSRINIPGHSIVEGTGLGLYLSQKIAALLDGDIQAKSVFGEGSVFILSLPLRYKEAVS
ncbi:MAG TPA: ATP-binding protein [Syntrophales bacterium]|nr:ATP-binding protein [Syntrophales bacterium]